MSIKSLSVKLSVLAFVVIIWATQSLLKTHHIELDFPVRLKTLNQELISTDNLSAYITVFVEGRGIDIYNMKKREYYIEVDAKNFTKGDNETLLNEQNIILHDQQYRGLITFHLNRNTVFSFDKISSREVPVELRFLTLEDEIFFKQRNISLFPEMVEIEGSQSYIESVIHITTIPLSAESVALSGYIVDLETPDNVLGIRPDAVKVIMESPVIITRTIPLIRIEYPEDTDIAIIPRYVTVKIEGISERIQSIRPNMIRAYIHIPPQYNYEFAPIRFDIPEGVELLEYTPQRVQIIQPDS